MTTYWTNTKLTFLQKLFVVECFSTIPIILASAAVDRLVLPGLVMALLFANFILRVPRTVKAGQQKSLLFAVGLLIASLSLMSPGALGKSSPWGSVVTGVTFALAVATLSTSLLAWNPLELGAE